MAKFSAFFMVLSFITIFCHYTVLTTSVIEHNRPKFISPLISLSPNYELEFTTFPDVVLFHVIVQTTGYVGFGFTLSENMANSDIFIAGVREGENYSGDYHGLSNGPPTLDDKQNWVLVNASESATATELYFSRLFTTSDTSGQDEGEIRVMFAIGSTDDISYHAERGTTVITIRESSPTPMPTTPTPDTNCTLPGIYFVPYPGNCSMYMVCRNYELQDEIQTCLPGTLFDPELGQCNLAELVNCRPVCPSNGIINLPHSRNCSLYWTCVSGEASLQECATGLYFDEFYVQCNLAELVLCPNTCPSTGIINLPHNRNCSLYWTCVSGQASLQECLPRLLFDKILGQCNLEENVNCELIF